MLCHEGVTWMSFMRKFCGTIGWGDCLRWEGMLQTQHSAWTAGWLHLDPLVRRCMARAARRLLA